MTAVLKLTRLRACDVEAYQPLTQQLTWLIELARLFKAPDAREQPRPAPQVKTAVGEFLDRLARTASEQPEHAKVIAQIVKAVRNRWWGLFTCYRIPNVPCSNNGLETFFKDLKHHQRRITGRKSVHEFSLRDGPFAACIDYHESYEALLTRLRQVSHADFLKARHAFRPAEVHLRKLHRYRHHPAEYFHELETRWEQALSSNRLT